MVLITWAIMRIWSCQAFKVCPSNSLSNVLLAYFWYQKQPSSSFESASDRSADILHSFLSLNFAQQFLLFTTSKYCANVVTSTSSPHIDDQCDNYGMSVFLLQAFNSVTCLASWNYTKWNENNNTASKRVKKRKHCGCTAAIRSYVSKWFN